MRKLTIIKVLGVLSIMAWVSVTTAEIFTISPPASLDSCDEEFENMANALQPGDELILTDGVYSQGCARSIVVNGTVDNPIIIRAADGASPLITRPNSTSPSSNNIEISGSYFTIRGMRFQYGSSGVRFFASNNITFEDNKIFDTLNNALTMNSGVTDSHIIRNNEIYNTGLATSGETEGEGIYIGKHSGGSEGTNHLIENNYIHDLRATSSGGNDGIEIKFGSGGNTIRGNVIHDTNIGQQFPCVFVYGHGAEPNIIENNLLYNCGEAILVTADAIIRNNVILNSSINGIHLRVQSPAPNVQNVTIVNNTVYGSHPVCAQLRIGSAPNITVANNAFYCEGSTAIAGNGFANATFANNVVRGALSGVSIDNLQFIQGTPAADNFVNVLLQDFRLLENSALIDAGSNSTPDFGQEDFAGTARISGSAIDVGAHEYSSTLSPPAPELTFAGPASVDANSSATLTWEATNATGCTASGGWLGSRAVSGTETTAALTADTSFTLTCTGDGGSVSESLTVSVTQSPPDAPELTFSGPASVTANSSAMLTWNTTNASSCTASGGWQGSRAVTGTQDTTALTADTSFTLTCTGAGGTVSDTLTVTVTQPPADSDADGLLDSWEQQYFSNLDQQGTGDPDGDLLQNLDEFGAGTDPTNADSDGDGSNDFEEVQAGSDPNDSNSKPTPVTPPVEPPAQNAPSSGGGPLNPLIILATMMYGIRRRR